jgi:hypothetical protein
LDENEEGNRSKPGRKDEGPEKGKKEGRKGRKKGRQEGQTASKGLYVEYEGERR